MILRV